MKAELVAKLEQFSSEISSCQKQISKSQHVQVRQADLKTSAASVARRWFDEFVPDLNSISFSAETVNELSQRFSDLLRYSRAQTTKKSYVRLLSSINADLKSDVIHAVEISSPATSGLLSIAPFIDGLRVDEGDYLAEAQRCLSVNGIRACIVLGWCATVSRMHDKIADLGFDRFNKASEDMTAKTFGRFKPFNKKFKVESISELRRMVFDTDLLWVLEFMQLIDSNQHERLRYCFELRNHSAHPGQAPVSGENLYSFYSDITSNVLKNPKFAVTPSSSNYEMR